jgi:alpha-mannosidase
MRRLYIVAISHLDTQWRWTLRDTIERHLPKTLRQCFDRFERFPSWVLSFDGAFRYRLIEEYYPEDFARLAEWVRRGRWGIAGAWLDAADVNLPSPESLVRQALYGVRYFQRRFGVRPRDVFLPDCFGFGWALPSIAAHCGLVGFSSQKLSKNRAAEPIPFALGRWAGVDGAEVIAALRPGGYGEPLDLAPSEAPVDQRYFGVGDTGGAPDGGSLRRLEAALGAPAPDHSVRTGPAGQIFAELAPDEAAALPRYSGELLLNLHASGCYTSQARMKRLNRRNQALARSAEAACAAADWLGALPYPGAQLRDAWERFLVHQFHDDLTGTSIPAAYEISANDELLSLNQFATLLRDAVGAIARGLDTRPRGGGPETPFVVWNPLEFERHEVVTALLPGSAAGALRILDCDGADVPAQILSVETRCVRIAFLATVPPTGCAVFHARWEQPTGRDGAPERAPFEIDGEGRLARLGPPGLLRPVELELLADTSWRFPAWEIRFEDVSAAPRECVRGPAAVETLAQGPLRWAVRVRRSCGRSRFVDIYRMDAGSEMVVVESAIEWRTRKRLLKLAVSADCDRPIATYALGLGSIERGVNSERLWEVPAQGWADLSSGDRARGLTVFTDSKHGWDRPARETLRLTLLHAPRVGRRFRHQGRQDLGTHEHRWALWQHGAVSHGEIARRSACFEHPLVAFRAPPHPGPLGRRWSFCALEGEGESLAMALKKEEDGDRFVVRVRESAGRPARPRLRFAGAARTIAEVNGVEEEQASAVGIEFDLTAHRPRAFALALEPPITPIPPCAAAPVELPGGVLAATWNHDRRAADFDGRGRSYPAELLPDRLVVAGVSLRLTGRALVCRGQWIDVPAGADPRRMLLLAAAVGPDASVPEWTGRADTARADVAWVGTHRHRRRGDDAYAFCYLWRMFVDVPAGATRVRLPDDPRVRVFAAGVVGANDLYDASACRG